MKRKTPCAAALTGALRAVACAWDAAGVNAVELSMVGDMKISWRRGRQVGSVEEKSEKMEVGGREERL